MSKQVWSTKNTLRVEAITDLPAKVLKSRGYSDTEIREFISPDYAKGLGDPFQLEGMKEAVTRIAQAIKKTENIVIYGDYDIDGLSASTLLYDALSRMGNTPDLYIPDRFEEGYGLNSKALEKIKKAGAGLVISVDCGVTAHKQAKLAKKIGLDLVITDHHEPDGKAPDGAIATINPKLQDLERLKILSGVGVAFYLVLGLQQKTGLLAKGQEKWLLDMVALGTVCDVVPMVGINRLLTKFGLIVMSKSNRSGLRALAEASGVELKNINEVDLGFKIGPRLNAAGRLTHAQKALELLTTDDSQLAKNIALELNQLNHERQQTTKQIFEEADNQARQYRNDPVLVLHSPDWSHGVVGIVASRIAEKWHKPAILLQELGASSKGSARSYGKFNIVEAIADSAQLLETFGGHAFAAGLKLQTDNIKELRFRINQYALKHMDIENNLKVLDVTIDLAARLNTLGLYDVLNQLAPFGNENSRPICTARFNVAEVRLVGSDASHLRMKLQDEDNNDHEAIGFGMGAKYDFLKPSIEVQLVYTINENWWNNQRKHQIEIIDIKPIE